MNIKKLDTKTNWAISLILLSVLYLSKKPELIIASFVILSGIWLKICLTPIDTSSETEIKEGDEWKLFAFSLILKLFPMLVLGSYIFLFFMRKKIWLPLFNIE
jgi:hypothetical protein